MKTKTKLKLKK